MVHDLGFGGQETGWVYGVGCRVKGERFRVWGLGYRVKGVECRDRTGWM
jgi:hypothetical protein